ncbi:MAG: magnesium chelatase ATPase subunit I [Deltaproteobacteria bacterium]|nr:magnesium chelatase ATPase subunit I [Nannocystaceae bacterium]
MPPFPFTAIVAQTELKLALQLVAIDPALGGVLIMGDRGTGKSTAVRALAQLLPPMNRIAGCPYNCDPTEEGRSCAPGCPARDHAGEITVEQIAVPVVDLPLGATEDRVVGALDLEAALTRGERVFSPGLLARANRGFLYIDEVNLLPDHLVDLLLDVAASGENVVEREGLSVRHPARFVLVGSGNPEEGELRPQLLDRFGLALEVQTPNDIATRVEVVKRRMAFDHNPRRFIQEYVASEAATTRQLVDARARLREVAVPERVIARAAALCATLHTDGLRGELTLIRAARAAASLEGAAEAEEIHLRRVAVLALCHRLRRDPMDEVGSQARVDRAIEEVFAP